jgi:SPP1 gp7 family putative phage head morphogenesis protein
MFRELRGLAREQYLEAQIRQLRMVYLAAQRSLAAKLREANLTDFQRFRAEKLLHEVEVITTSLDRSAYRWAKATMPLSYDRGIDLAAERLKALGVTRYVSYDADIHTSSIQILIDDVTKELLIANDGMKKLFNRFIRATQQTVLQDTEISRMIAQGLIEGQARRTVSDVILKEMRRQLENEQFIVINGRNYRPDSYAKLIARTRTREASSEGTINTSLRYGCDLVQWDSHAEICEYCAQFAGRVYSISGMDAAFPALVEQPPLHPNCRCVITPVTREALIDRGQLEAIITLSNNPLIEVDSFSRFEEVLSEI